MPYDGGWILFASMTYTNLALPHSSAPVLFVEWQSTIPYDLQTRAFHSALYPGKHAGQAVTENSASLLLLDVPQIACSLRSTPVGLCYELAVTNPRKPCQKGLWGSCLHLVSNESCSRPLNILKAILNQSQSLKPHICDTLCHNCWTHAVFRV